MHRMVVVLIAQLSPAPMDEVCAGLRFALGCDAKQV